MTPRSFLRTLGFALAITLSLAACREAADKALGPFDVETVALDVTASDEAFVPTLDGPLRVLSATPFGEAVAQVDRQPVAVTFSRPMVPLGDAPTPDASALTVRQNGQEIAGTLAWDGTQTLVWTPDEPLDRATPFEARLAAGIEDLDGEALEDAYTWTFETPRPRLLESTPDRGEAHAEPGEPIRLRYNQAVRAGDADDVITLTADGERVGVTVRADGDSTVLVQPGSGLARGTRYVLRIAPGLPSAQGPLGTADSVTVRFETYGDLQLEAIGQSRRYDDPPGDNRPLDPARAIELTFSNPVAFQDVREAITLDPAAPLPAGVEASDGRTSGTHTIPYELAPETEYTMTVRGLEDAFGQTMAPTTRTFRTGSYRPAFSIPQGILVIEADEMQALPVRATNVPAVRVGLRQLDADAIVPALRAHDRQHWYGDRPEGTEEPEPIAAADTFRIDLDRNQPGRVPLALASVIGGETGVVAVRALSDHRGRGENNLYDARAIAQVTRLGLTAKFSPHQQLVFVTDLATARPIRDASVTIRDERNRVLWTGETDITGRAQIPGWNELGVEKTRRWESPRLFAIVQLGDDLAFTSSIYDDGVEPYRFDVNTDWAPEPISYAGSVFSDRGLYKSGETVHLKGILRQKTDADWRPVTDSARVIVRSPRDEIVLDRRIAPSDWGTFDLDWTAPAEASQGSYSVRIASTTDTTATDTWSPSSWATGRFRVDSFRRASFAVTPRTSTPAYVAGDFFEGTIEGRYLFGAPMGGQPVTYSLQQSPGYFSPEGFDAFRFGPLDAPYLSERLAAADTVLSPEGTVSRRVRLPGNENGLPTTLTWEATVTDPARQEQSGRQTLTLHPALFYVGLRPQTTYLDLSEDQQVSIDVVTVDPAGVPVGGHEVTVELVRQQWNSVREVGADGRLRWRSEKVEESLGTQTVESVEGQMARLTLPVETGGQYIVRASSTDLRGNAVRTEAFFWAAGGGYVAWERSDDDRVDLVLDQTSYTPGETARVLVQSPFETATVLVTVEREGVIESRIETLTGSAPQVEIELDERHLPNVFVSVVLLHGRSAQPTGDADPGAPQFRMGLAEIRVDAESRRLTVEVEPQNAKVRPGDEVTVDIRLKDSNGRGVAGEVAFSAADAGVLNLIGYSLPDPFDAFYGPRPLGVRTSVSLAELVRQRNYGQKEEDLGGGGGDNEDRMRRDFRPLAHWAPAIRTNGSGRARVTFRVPESLTTFRLMATALTPEHAFGSGSTDLVVTQPLVLQPALPRFSRLGDAFEAGVLVSNRTDEAGTATVSAEADGLQLEGPTEKTVELAAGETKEVRFNWQVETIGSTPPEVRFTTTMGRERDAFATVLPVALPTVRTATATFSSTDGRASEALRIPASALPNLGSFRASVSSTALVGLDGASRYLFQYPYGCLEQTTSRVRPLLVGADLLDAYDLSALDGDRDSVIREWIASLDAYWMGNGFALWKGGRQANLYTSAYAILALAEAEAAGVSVPGSLTNESVEWLERAARNPSQFKPTYYSDAVWADTRALMLYALARHGRVLAAEINQLASNANLSNEGAATLLRTVPLDAALNRIKTPLTERLTSRMRVEATSAYLDMPEGDGWGWIFASDARATAHALTALVESDPSAGNRQLGQRMVRFLMSRQQGGHWASTQENAAVVDAFRAFADAYEKDTPAFTATVAVAGRELLKESFQGRSLDVAEAERPLTGLPRGEDVPVTLDADGSGRAYYLFVLDTYSSQPAAARSNGLTVARTIQPIDDKGDSIGSPLASDATLEAGQLVRVTIRLTSPTTRSYIVVDDALPAGLEALNAAFDTSPDAARQGTGQARWWGSFNHTEIRDDRVLLFADRLMAGAHSYTYLARATTPGTFVHPPAQAEAMYSPEVMGRTATGRLTVSAP
ncbi:MAG: MG2 domain-containing protein [Rubricoccaceae bacterium]